MLNLHPRSFGAEILIRVSYRFDTNTLGLYKYLGLIDSKSFISSVVVYPKLLNLLSFMITSHSLAWTMKVEQIISKSLDHGPFLYNEYPQNYISSPNDTIFCSFVWPTPMYDN